MTISFPGITANIVGSNTIQNNQPQRVLLVGQKSGAGTAPAGELVENIGNNGEHNALFGENSMLANMVNAFKVDGSNTVTRLDAIPLDDDGGATQATSTLTFAGTPTATGTFTLYVGSKKFAYTVNVTTSDTPTSVATSMAALINADSKVQVTAGSAAGVVTLTAVNGGLEGNFIGVRADGEVAGMTQTLTAMAGGATNPTLTGVFDPIDGIRYQTIVWPSSYDRDVVNTLLESRFNVINNILDGIAVQIVPETFATFKATVTALNSKSLVLGINPPVVSAPDNRFDHMVFEVPNMIASQVAAKRSIRLTDGANIADVVVSGASADTIGGIELSSLPYANTPFPALPIIEAADLLSRAEIKELNDAGGFVLSNNIAGNTLVLGQLVTTYKTNAAGNADITFKFANYVDTAVAAREFIFNNSQARFRQSRLTNGELTEFRSIANEASIAAFLDAQYQLLEDRMLVVKGDQALRFFKANRNVTIDLGLGKASINAKLRILTQLRELTFNFEIVFDEDNTL